MQRKIVKSLRRAIKRPQLIGGVILAAVLILFVIQFIQPQRSVGAYCRTYKQEDTELSNAYGSAAFSQGSTNPSVYVTAFAKLDRVAPNDIEPEVNQLKKVFQTITTDPAQSLGASVSGLSAGTSVTNWTHIHCRN